jgi:hypothetical protein
VFLCVWSLGHGTFLGRVFLRVDGISCAFVPLCLCTLGPLFLWAFVPLVWDEFSLVVRIFLAFLGFSYIFFPCTFACYMWRTGLACVGVRLGRIRFDGTYFFLAHFSLRICPCVFSIAYFPCVFSWGFPLGGSTHPWGGRLPVGEYEAHLLGVEDSP